MAVRSAWYLTKYDVESVAGWLVRKPAICRHFPVERPDVVWSEIETINGGCLVKVHADDVHHAVLSADPDFTAISSMTPAELAKITKAMRDLGFSNAEINACGGDQASLLSRLSAERSVVARSGATVVYGARRPNDKKLAEVDARAAKVAAVKRAI